VDPLRGMKGGDEREERKGWEGSNWRGRELENLNFSIAASITLPTVKTKN